MDIIYKYNLSLTVNNLLERVKKYFNIIFKETIEKYVFLRLSADELHELLKFHYFNSTDEYYFVEGIKLWLKYDLKHRLDNAQSLFSLINCGSCSKDIMLEYIPIDTGNCKLNEIIEQIHLNISINNNTALELFKLDEVNIETIDPSDDTMPPGTFIDLTGLEFPNMDDVKKTMYYYDKYGVDFYYELEDW